MARRRAVVSLPSVVSRIPQDERQWIDRVNSALNSGVFATSDELSAMRDELASLLDTKTSAAALVATLTSDAAVGEDGNKLFPLDPTPDRECGDTEYPEAPAGLKADGAFQNIIVTWDQAAYCGHSYTEIWASAEDDLSTAVAIGQTAWGNVYIHATGEGARFYYWARFVNDRGDVGAYNSTTGTLGETAPDIAYLLELLTGEITESQLYTDLGARIDLIDAPDTVDGSVAQRISQIASQLGEALAAVETKATVQADSINGLMGQYTVKIDLDGYVTGYGLASQAPVGGTPTSEFIVRADRFSVGSPTENDIMPFVVQTRSTTINGETVPAGVYMNTAFIQNGSITNAKIGDAAIDNAKIADLSAGKITSGSITVGTEIKSSSYSSGNYGWRIRGDGTIEAFNGYFTGRIEADEGYFRATIQGGDATGWTTGHGLYAGPAYNNGPYVFRVGTPTRQRMTWDGAGINIYNNSGALILTTNANSVADSITGLGALAFRNALGYSELSGLPALGQMSLLNYLTRNNITTYIEGAAIGSALIGHAAVGTLHIAGRAVTIPGGAAGGYSCSVTLYAPESMSFMMIATFSQGTGRHGEWWSMYLDNQDIQAESPAEGTTGAMGQIVTVSKGYHRFFIGAHRHVGGARCAITVMGAIR